MSNENNKTDNRPSFKVEKLTPEGRAALQRLIDKHPELFVEGATPDNPKRNGKWGHTLEEIETARKLGHW